MKDIIARGMSMDGNISVIAANTTVLVEKARQLHLTSPVATAALGRTLTAASMIGISLKDEKESVTLRIKGDGPIGGITVVTDHESNVRGFVNNPMVELPINEYGKLDVGGAVGKGTFTFIKDMGLKEPYVGQTPLVTGEISQDITYYFATSQQVPTSISLGVLVDTDGKVNVAGGCIAQLMPGATDEVAEKLEQNVLALPSITTMLNEGLTPDDIIYKITDGFGTIVYNEKTYPEYVCKCSKDKMIKALISLGKEEIDKLIDSEEEVEMVCHFCNFKYVFSDEEIKAIRDSL